MASYDYNQIAVFVSVVEQKGVRAAAERLGMAQSSVSRAIAALESRLGTRLVERSTRSFRVTEEGQRYYEHCRAALDVISQADALLHSRRDELAGTVRITAPAVLGKYLLSEVLTTFLARYPKARASLDVTDRLVDLVPEGVDIAVRIGPLPASSSLVTRHLARPAAGLYASASYLRDHGVPRKPDDLQGHRTLTLGIDADPCWVLQRDQETSVQRLHPVLQTNDIPTLLNATLQGGGICMAPHFVCTREHLPEALLQVLPEWEVEGVDVRVLYPSRRSVTPLLRAFVDLLAERAPLLLDLQPAHGGERSQSISAAPRPPSKSA